MTGITTRAATPEDLAALCWLYWAFHEFHTHHVPDRLRSRGDYRPEDWAALAEMLAPLLASDTAIILVAELDDQLVGFAEVHLQQDAPHPARVCRCYGYLAALFLLEAFRRQDLGRRLVQTAEGWARGRGATELRLDMWEFADSALPFYERLGYHTLSRTLVKAVLHVR